MRSKICPAAEAKTLAFKSKQVSSKNQSKGVKGRFGCFQLCHGYFGKALRSVYIMSLSESQIFLKTLLEGETLRQEQI